MIEFIIAYDEENDSLGNYFNDCQQDITDLLENNVNVTLQHIPSRQCNAAYIDIRISALTPNPFIFVAYSHGIEDALKCKGDSFISLNNCHHFIHSLFYSTACLIGRELGNELITKGCKAFIGFIEKSTVSFVEQFQRTFIQCDNYALHAFMTMDNITIGGAFEMMKDFYTSQIDRILELGDPICAGYLMKNRDALVCLGDKNLKKENLIRSH